jgi:hypothetical protein
MQNMVKANHRPALDSSFPCESHLQRHRLASSEVDRWLLVSIVGLAIAEAWGIIGP